MEKDIKNFMSSSSYTLLIMLSDTIRRIGIGLFLKDLVDDMWKALKQDNEKLKMKIYSGHDNTLGPLLTSLGVQL